MDCYLGAVFFEAARRMSAGPYVLPLSFFLFLVGSNFQDNRQTPRRKYIGGLVLG